MFGLQPAPVERCRYLEIGCGDGTHLIACALGLPNAHFVGIDQSAAAVERGNQVIAKLNLPNVSLAAADLTDWQPPSGRFDYAVAHGLYSWVPAPVRDSLLALVARVLTPEGIAYVSYNTYPGCYVRRMVWEVLKHHTAGTTVPADKMQQSLEFARLLQAGLPAGKSSNAALALLEPELKEITQQRDPRVLYHDDLSEVNDPVYFHQFAAHAGCFGLRFAAEAEPHWMETRSFPPEVAAHLDSLAAFNVVEKEQYIDFLRLRRFRQTLLCLDTASPRIQPDPGKLSGLLVSGNPKAENNPVDLTEGTSVTFRVDQGATAQSDRDVVKAALVELAEAWPARLPFSDLLGSAVGRLQRRPGVLDADYISRFLTAAWMMGMVELHGRQPAYVREVSERPVASPLARLQLRRGVEAATLLHCGVKFEDAVIRGLVLLLDGTRDLNAVVEALRDAYPPDRRPGHACAPGRRRAKPRPVRPARPARRLRSIRRPRQASGRTKG